MVDMNYTPPPPPGAKGFTLIELSIVLVIIGLIIGGVLVGQDLISAAATRATIAQIEKYNTAANTFVTKYGYLPGDIPDPYASQFGLAARGVHSGQGDGNGIIEGVWDNSGNANSDLGTFQGAGETVMFWSDLTKVGFLDGKFTSASPVTPPFGSLSATQIATLLPAAKLGQGNYIYVWSGGWAGSNNNTTDGKNYFSVAGVSAITSSGTTIGSSPNITVSQAFGMDKKVDDGIPQSGRVLAIYPSGYVSVCWAGSGQCSVGAFPVGPWTSSTTGSASTCFDNGGGSGAQHYSMEQSNGSGPNCALSFQMQGAAR